MPPVWHRGWLGWRKPVKVALLLILFALAIAAQAFIEDRPIDRWRSRNRADQ